MNDDIATRLQLVRQRYGLSQRELAKRAGVTNSSISMIEQGRVSPSISSLDKLLGAIPMSISQFFSLDLSDLRPLFFKATELCERPSHAAGLESYRLAPQNDSGNQLIYQVFNPGSHTGQLMIVSAQETAAIIVQGVITVTSHSERKQLVVSDGFVIPALFPYRLDNETQEQAAVVIQRYHPRKNN